MVVRQWRQTGRFRLNKKELIMKKYIKICVACLLLAAFSASIAGCNTMRGLGKDIERGGEKLQNSTNN